MCTNIPHNEGMKACRTTLNVKHIQQPPMGDLVQLIKINVNNEQFTFEEDHYLQLHGTAMAHSYVNLFMVHLEEKLLN